MTTKVKVYTSSIPISRSRPVDMDHAVLICDHLRRGYHISVRADHSQWSCAYYLFDGNGGKPFANSGEGMTHSVQFRPHKGTEDARLLDEPYPEWMIKLNRTIARTKPETWEFHAGEENPNG